MKTLMTALLAFGILFSTYANNKVLNETTSVEIKENSFMLKMAAPLGRIHVSIYDPKGKMIERNLFKVNEPLNIPYNLSQLPEGSYKVKLETKEESMTFEVVNKKKLEKKLLAYAKATDNQTITLKVLGIEKPGTKVVLYDQNHKKIVTDNIHVLGGFERNYVLQYIKTDQVYMKVMNAEGKSKYLYFD